MSKSEPLFPNKHSSPEQTTQPCDILLSKQRPDEATCLKTHIHKNKKKPRRRHCILFKKKIIHFTVLIMLIAFTMNWPTCCLVFLRRLGVELGKAQVYQEANRGRINSSWTVSGCLQLVFENTGIRGGVFCTLPLEMMDILSKRPNRTRVIPELEILPKTVAQINNVSHKIVPPWMPYRPKQWPNKYSNVVFLQSDLQHSICKQCITSHSATLTCNMLWIIKSWCLFPFLYFNLCLLFIF